MLSRRLAFAASTPKYTSVFFLGLGTSEASLAMNASGVMLTCVVRSAQARFSTMHTRPSSRVHS